MSNYYEKRKAGVNIAHALMNLNWNVYSYKKDESDSMTDYYSPAYWNGIAEKNGFILVVDNSFASEEKEITKYNSKGNLSFEDQEKINKLEQMTQKNGATAGEEENAKVLIEKLQAKVSGESQYIVIGKIPAYMANPGRCIWHIEKDGKIYDKGNALTKYADIPADWEFDFVKMEYKSGYDTWFNGEKKILTDEQVKAVNDFKALILRFERVVNNMSGMGDGTTETEQKGLEQQAKEGYEKVIVPVTKKVIKPILKDDTIININDVLSFSYHGHYWVVTSIYQNSKEQTCVVYELLGSEKRGYQRLHGTSVKRYYQVESRLQKEIAEGKVKVYTLQEVKETKKVEKWVKINQSKTTYNNNTKTESKQEKEVEQPEQTETINTVVNSNISNYELTITADVDTRDNSPLWVVKVVDKLSKEEYKKVAGEFKELKGYYSKFKHGFIFKYDPTDVLKGESEEIQEEQQQEAEQTIKKVTRTPEQETADNIIDMSFNIITELGIDGSTIFSNEEYKTMLYDYIKNNSISITNGIIDCLKAEEGYNNLIDVLQLIHAVYWQPIKDGFIYNCHFKQWGLPMEQIQESITLMNISFIDMGEKIGFEGLTAEQTRQVKNISDINGSILFIDSETPEVIINTDNNDMEAEQQHQEQPEELNNTFDFDDDILSKFDNIEINNNSRISADDEEFCIVEQEQYNIAITMMLNLMEEIKKSSGMDLLNGKWYEEKSSNKYLDSYKLKEIVLIIDGIKQTFIDKITYHFSNKYNVTIKKERMQKNYGYDITYNNIIDDIILQLDGFTFTEKAIKELKDKTRTTYSYSDYRKTSNMSIKNNKVIIDGRYAYKDSIWNQYRLNGDFGKIFTALYHFENGTMPTDGTELHNRYCGYANEKNENNYDKYEITTLTKATAIKFFKNGKLEIEFKSNQYATYFAKEYLGYIEKVA